MSTTLGGSWVATARGLAEAATALDGAGISWAIMRLTFDPARPRGDIDVVVDPAAIDRAADMLCRLGFASPAWITRPSLGLVRYDEGDHTWTWIDLHERFDFGRRQLPPSATETLLSRRRRHGGLWLVDPSDEFWGLLARVLLDGRPIGGRHKARLVELLPDVDTNGPICLGLEAAGVPAATFRHAQALVAAHAWEQLQGLHMKGQQERYPTHRWRRVQAAVRSVLDPAHHGLSVAILGPDGAGKSTLAQTLAAQYPFATCRIYMGVGPPPGTNRRVLLMAVPASLVGLGRQWVRFLVGRYNQMRGRMVLFDRYMEDPWLPLPADVSVARRLGRRVRAAVSCPPADLMLVLDAPGSEMFARKGEHSAAQLEKLRQRYLRLGERIPNVVVLDATSGADAMARQASELIWRRYRERWKNCDEPSGSDR